MDSLEKPEVEIHNWYIVGKVLFGDAKGHPELGSQFIRTPTIQKFIKDEGIVETRNTIYRLIGGGHFDGELVGGSAL